MTAPLHRRVEHDGERTAIIRPGRYRFGELQRIGDRKRGEPGGDPESCIQPVRPLLMGTGYTPGKDRAYLNTVHIIVPEVRSNTDLVALATVRPGEQCEQGQNDEKQCARGQEVSVKTVSAGMIHSIRIFWSITSS